MAKKNKKSVAKVKTPKELKFPKEIYAQMSEEVVSYSFNNKKTYIPIVTVKKENMTMANSGRVATYALVKVEEYSNEKVLHIKEVTQK